MPRTVLAPLTGPQVNVLGIHLRRGFAQAAEERVYIPAGAQVNVLGIHFRAVYRGLHVLFDVLFLDAQQLFPREFV